MSISVQKVTTEANPADMGRWSPWKRDDAAEPLPGAARPTFEALYDERIGYVWHVLRRLGVRGGEREDVIQDVFLCVHRALPGFDPARPVLPWLHGIAFHVAKNHQRRVRAHRQETLVEEPADLDPPDPAPDPEQRTAAEQSREIVIRLMQGIELDQRVVLSMHDLDGMGMGDIVRELGITLSAGYKRLQRARAELQAAADRLSARERQAMGVAAFVPVDLTKLLDADRFVPDLPADVNARMWGRLQGALALGGPGATSAPVHVPAPAPSLGTRIAAQVGRQVAPFVTGALVGAAALHALGPRAALPAAPVPVSAEVAIIAAPLPAAPSPTVPVATGEVAAAPPVTASAAGVPVAVEDEGDLLRRAQAARSRGDLPAALAALDRHARRYPAGRLAADREALRAQIVAQQRAAGASSTTPVGTSPPAATPTAHRMFGTDP
jgi:RNA polymerase sigma-70 factor (ECF subfamily)